MNRSTLAAALTFGLLSSTASAQAPGHPVTVIPLQHLEVGHVEPIVSRLLSEEGFVASHHQTNTLIVVDEDPAVARIHALLRTLEERAAERRRRR